MVVTSSFFNNNINREYTKVRISVSAPKGIPYTKEWLTVAPDWNTILKPYKDGVIDDTEYTRRYLKQLNCAKELIKHEFKTLKAKYPDMVLLCWCKKGNFCHRRILAEWLENQGFEKIYEL